MTTHALERTNAKGIKFVGKCTRCGMTGLSSKAALEPCENTKNISNDSALLLAIEGAPA